MVQKRDLNKLNGVLEKYTGTTWGDIVTKLSNFYGTAVF